MVWRASSTIAGSTEMHVGLFAPAWPLEGHASGVVTYVHWLREGLLRRGHRVTVFAGEVTRPEPGVRHLAASLAFRAQRWWRWRREPGYEPVFDWGAQCAAHVLSAHRRDPIDVLEMEESFGWAADVARLTRLPTVVKLHGPGFLTLFGEDARNPLGRARIAREGEALRQVPVITAPAQRTLDATLAHYGLSPAVARHVVNPIELPADAPVWRADACDRKTLLFVGRFDAVKGGDIMLQAFARLLQDDGDLRLVFVGPDVGLLAGDGRRRHLGQCLAEWLGARADRVDVRGPQPPAVVCRVRAEAAATVIASRWENQSYTMLEAMLQGCPIVSSDAGGQRESVRHGQTGLLAAAGEVGAFVTALRALLDDPARAAALGARARAHVLALHAPERVVDETLEVYARAIELPRPPARRVAAAPL
jgi:glycosyltransferase involved in cell wall biosynthesis